MIYDAGLMTIKPEDIEQAHLEYLQHLALNDGMKRFGEGRMRASELGSCEYAVAQRRLGAKETHPQAGNDHAALSRMHQGKLTGAVWADAMDWYFSQHGYQVIPEQPLTSNVLVGQADIVIYQSSDTYQKAVVEIKNTGYWLPQPKHFLQLGAYMKMCDAQQGFLVYQRPDFTISVFEAQRVDQAIEERMAELDEVTKDVEENGLPIRTLDELIYGYCCAEKESIARPHKFRGRMLPGRVTVRCPFFGNCYAIPRTKFYTDFGDTGLKVADEGEINLGDDIDGAGTDLL